MFGYRIIKEVEIENLKREAEKKLQKNSEEYKKIIDLSVEDDRIRRYLKGETLDVDDLVKNKDKGWFLVCVDGYPLGFGKLSNGTLKNKYLPGWRLC